VAVQGSPLRQMQQPNLPQLQAQLRLLLQARAQMQTSPMLARQGQPMQAFQPQAQQAVPTQLQPAQLFPMLQAPQNRTQASPTLALQGQPGTLALQALQPQAQQAVLHLFQAPQNQTQRPQTPSGTQLIQPQPLPSPRQSSTTSQSQSGKENKRPADEDDDADEDPKHKFPEDEVLELIAAIKAAAEEDGQENMGQHAQVWKRLSGVFNRTSDVLFFKWKALQFAANKAKAPRTGQNMPLFQDKPALRELRKQVKDVVKKPLGLFTPKVYAAVLDAMGVSNAKAVSEPCRLVRRLGRLAAGLDFFEKEGSVSAVAAAAKAVKASGEGRVPTSGLLQAKRAGKKSKATSQVQPSNQELLDRMSMRSVEMSMRIEQQRAQRDIDREYERRLTAWEQQCERMQEAHDAAARAIYTEHLKVAASVCPGDRNAMMDMVEELTASHDHEVFVFATSSVIISNFIFAQTLPILILIL
ncbi:hypothetical protein QJQ45_029849, partial [Haematococcus lacustris]